MGVQRSLAVFCMCTNKQTLGVRQELLQELACVFPPQVNYICLCTWGHVLGMFVPAN